MVNKIYNSINPLKICLLPGDGIGPEVMEAALPVLKALKIPHQIFLGKIGWNYWCKDGNPLPQATWELIKKTDVTLLGAVTSKPMEEAEKALPKHLQGTGHVYVSPVIQLRQHLKLFANVRPVMDFTTKSPNYNLTIIRENTEGLYCGLDFPIVHKEIKELIIKNNLEKFHSSSLNNATYSIRLQTQKGLERLFNFSFEYAQNNGYKKITWADKPNVLRYSGNFARKILLKISEKYSHIECDIQNIDAVAMQMIKKPESYGVIVAENMFGDILSDLGAGIMGGLGLAPSGNVGSNKCYFEPVHGSAPKHACLNRVNPAAMFLTISLMLNHCRFNKEARIIKNAVRNVINNGLYLTYDLGGTATTTEMAKAIIEQCLSPTIRKKVSIIATGKELVEGEVVNTNSSNIAKKLSESSIEVQSHIVVSDDLHQIKEQLQAALKKNEAVIICGGLGPTSDDQTIFAVSSALGRELMFSRECWVKIEQRLKTLNIGIDECNKKQALIPRGAEILPNNHGTAAGSIIDNEKNIVIMLPGPPKECLPMFEQYVLPKLINLGFKSSIIKKRWRLLGVIESNIAPLLDATISKGLQTAYCWSYPYLDFYVSTLETFGNNSIPYDAINSVVKEYFVTSTEMNASAILKEILIADPNIILFIDDCATGEEFFANLCTPATQKQVKKKEIQCAEFKELDYFVSIKGLEEFWHNLPYQGNTTIKINIKNQGVTESFSLQIPYSSELVRKYAIEYTTHVLVKKISLRFPKYKQLLPS